MLCSAALSDAASLTPADGVWTCRTDNQDISAMEYGRLMCTHLLVHAEMQHLRYTL